MDLKTRRYTFTGLERFNVILGKNGCGKSTALREIDQDLRDVAKFGRRFLAYLSPERGGELKVQGQIETQRQDPTWLPETRRRNADEQFRHKSVSQYQRLESAVLRRIEADPHVRQSKFTFDTVVDQINALLSNVYIVRDAGNNAFRILRKEGPGRGADQISSGETELISLAIEILAFVEIARTADYRGSDNILMIDEPDVHLHPDLQQRLIDLLVGAIDDQPCRVIMATHSTAIVSALAQRQDARVCFMSNGAKELNFEPVSDVVRDVLPIFGAHPLSNVFNESPILLVEGEDDERIWQQAVRSSGGSIRLWPCAAGDKDRLNRYETTADRITSAVYDAPRAFSLRDRDDDAEDIADVGHVRRARLHCRAAENLLLADDTLRLLHTDWPAVRAALEAFSAANPHHQQSGALRAFRDRGWDRCTADLKELRNIIMMAAGSSKPWEVAVGQAIAGLKAGAMPGADGLVSYLGDKIVDALQLMPGNKA